MCSYELDGVARMRERPILDLVTGLQQLGADVKCSANTDCPPVEINAKGGLPGGTVKFFLFLVCNIYPVLNPYFAHMLKND